MYKMRLQLQQYCNLSMKALKYEERCMSSDTKPEPELSSRETWTDFPASSRRIT
jgi:hypothetical protein